MQNLNVDGFERYPSILISKDTIQEEGLSTSEHVFILVCGFKKDKPPIMILHHCPFCGLKLRDFYTDDNYVNGHWDDLGLLSY